MTFAFALALLIAASPLSFTERVDGARAAVGPTSRLPRATLAHEGRRKGREWVKDRRKPPSNGTKGPETSLALALAASSCEAERRSETASRSEHGVSAAGS